MLSSETNRLTAAMDGRAEIVEYLLTIRQAMRHGLRTRVDHRPLLSSSRTLFAYLRASMAYETVEQLRVLYLSTRNELIADEIAAIGDVASVAIDADHIARRARSLGSGGVILSHNHPSGDHTPSRSDVTHTLAFALSVLGYGVRLVDHVVVARSGISSLRALGLLEPGALCA